MTIYNQNGTFIMVISGYIPGIFFINFSIRPVGIFGII